MKKKVDFKNSDDFEEAVNEKIDFAAIAIKADMRESWSRRKKAVIFGLPMPTEGTDEDLVKELVTKLNLGDIQDSIKDVYRHKQPANSPSPPIVSIEFSSKVYRSHRIDT